MNDCLTSDVEGYSADGLPIGPIDVMIRCGFSALLATNSSSTSFSFALVRPLIHYKLLEIQSKSNRAEILPVFSMSTTVLDDVM